MEQTELGAAATGVVAITVGCSWSWELGWHVRIGARRSGSDMWREVTASGVGEEQLPGLVNDMLAEVLELF